MKWINRVKTLIIFQKNLLQCSSVLLCYLMKSPKFSWKKLLKSPKYPKDVFSKRPPTQIKDILWMPAVFTFFIKFDWIIYGNHIQILLKDFSLFSFCLWTFLQVSKINLEMITFNINKKNEIFLDWPWFCYLFCTIVHQIFP